RTTSARAAPGRPRRKARGAEGAESPARHAILAHVELRSALFAERNEMNAAWPDYRSASGDFLRAGRRAFTLLIAGGIGLAGWGPKVENASAQVASQPPARKSSGPTAPKEPRKDQLGWLTVSLKNPPANSVMAVPPEKLSAYVKDLYRIRPDR